MPDFYYEAYGLEGEIVKDRVSAASQSAAHKALAAAGKTPFVLVPASHRQSDGTTPRVSRAVSARDMTRLFDDISILMHSRFTIDQSLAASVANAQRNRQTTLQERLLASLRDGRSTAKSFADVGAAEDIVALIAAGETSGKLADVFEVIAREFRQQAKRRSDIREALLYPVFLVAMMLVTVGILAFYLVPAIEPVFDASKTPKPVVFVALDHARAFLSGGGLIPTAAFVASLISIVLLPGGRRAIGNLAFALPVVGRFLTEGTLARYMRILGLLLENGVAPKEAMRLSTSSAKTPRVRALLDAAGQDVQSGSSMHKAFTKTGLFAQSMIARIRLGEESNSLPFMLSQCVVTIERKQKQSIDRLMTFLTPAITISLGFIVGALVISVMSALLSINDIVLR